MHGGARLPLTLALALALALTLTLTLALALTLNPSPNPSPNQALFACASELPSAEYLFVDDGSETNQVTGALPALLRRLSAEYGIRFQLDRYRVSVGFTMAT